MNEQKKQGSIFGQRLKLPKVKNSKEISNDSSLINLHPQKPTKPKIIPIKYLNNPKAIKFSTDKRMGYQEIMKAKEIEKEIFAVEKKIVEKTDDCNVRDTNVNFQRETDIPILPNEKSSTVININIFNNLNDSLKSSKCSSKLSNANIGEDNFIQNISITNLGNSFKLAKNPNKNNNLYENEGIGNNQKKLKEKVELIKNEEKKFFHKSNNTLSTETNIKNKNKNINKTCSKIIILMLISFSIVIIIVIISFVVYLLMRR